MPVFVNNRSEIERRRSICEAAKHVTLDGVPARVVGYASEHAEVWSEQNYTGVAFAWPTAIRIMQSHGQFKS